MLLFFIMKINHVFANEEIVIISNNDDFFTTLTSLNLTSSSGNLVIKLTTDIECSKFIDIPPSLDSLKILSNDDNVYNISFTTPYPLNSIFANGVPLTIGENINIMGSVFGGGYNIDIDKDVNLNILGNVKVAVTGGGLAYGNFDKDESALTNGNINITVSGIIGNGIGDKISCDGYVYGGGFAYAGEGNFADASVNGDIKINLLNNGIHLKNNGEMFFDATKGGHVKQLAGGGYASNFGNNSHSKANVNGNTELHIYGRANDVYGGGIACLNYLYKTNVNIESNISGSTFLNYYNMSANSFDGGNNFGGGFADSIDGAQNSTIYANVGEGTTIIVDNSILNTDYYLMKICGGGIANCNGVSNVLSGGTKISIGRSSSDIIGGGSSYNGGTAQVVGGSDITLNKIINPSIDDSHGMLYGGGYAYSASDFLTSNSDMKGNANIHIKKDAYIAGSSFGGGYASGNASAKVMGNCIIDFDGKKDYFEGSLMNPLLFGGGFAEAYTNNIADASIIGDITLNISGSIESATLDDGNVEDSAIFGGGLAAAYNNSNAIANANKIDINVLSSAQIQSVWGGGLAHAKGGATSNAKVIYSNTYIEGGIVSATKIKPLSLPQFSKIYSGGYAINNDGSSFANASIKNTNLLIKDITLGTRNISKASNEIHQNGQKENFTNDYIDNASFINIVGSINLQNPFGILFLGDINSKDAKITLNPDFEYEGFKVFEQHDYKNGKLTEDSFLYDNGELYIKVIEKKDANSSKNYIVGVLSKKQYPYFNDYYNYKVNYCMDSSKSIIATTDKNSKNQPLSKIKGTILDKSIVAEDLGNDWIDLYKPKGYKSEVTYPVISSFEEENIVTVIYTPDKTLPSTGEYDDLVNFLFIKILMLFKN